MRRVQNKKNFKRRRKITLIALIIFSILAVVSSLYIVQWFKDNKDSEKTTQEIEKIAEVTEIEDNINTEIIEQEEEILKDDPYWDFIKLNLINVDFTDLKAQNSSTVGWIQVNGTNINYPFVQTEDNEYYLTRSFDKSYNQAGWIFLDYRNNINTLDKNTIIYGHSRLNKTMFGSLINIFTSRMA